MKHIQSFVIPYLAVVSGFSIGHLQSNFYTYKLGRSHAYLKSLFRSLDIDNRLESLFSLVSLCRFKHSGLKNILKMSIIRETKVEAKGVSKAKKFQLQVNEDNELIFNSGNKEVCVFSQFSILRSSY